MAMDKKILAIIFLLTFITSNDYIAISKHLLTMEDVFFCPICNNKLNYYNSKSFRINESCIKNNHYYNAWISCDYLSSYETIEIVEDNYTCWVRHNYSSMNGISTTLACYNKTKPSTFNYTQTFDFYLLNFDSKTIVNDIKSILSLIWISDDLIHWDSYT
jgi:hypothetical protein